MRFVCRYLLKAWLGLAKNGKSRNAGPDSCWIGDEERKCLGPLSRQI